MRRRFAWAVLIASTLAGCSALAVRHARRSPALPYLFPEGEAEWIHFHDRLLDTYIGDGTFTTAFRKTIVLEQPLRRPTLTLAALRKAQVYVDGELVYRTGSGGVSWKRSERVLLPEPLYPGFHELVIVVSNRNGPACLLAYSDDLDIATDSTWEAGREGETWTPAAAVDARHEYTVARSFPRADAALCALLPWYFPLFSIVTIAMLAWSKSGRAHPRAVRPEHVRWLVLAAWVVLGINNMFKLPGGVGFDIDGHMAYIRYVAEHWRVPLPTEGWTTFQPPLFYFFSAPVYAILKAVAADETAMCLLRLVPISCAAAQIELCYRATRTVWRDRPDLQILGTMLGGLLPLHTYASQYLSNEPLAGLLTSVIVVLAFRGLLNGTERPRPRFLVGLGLVFGAALLSKITAVLLVPALIYALLVSPASAPAWQRVLCSARRAVIVFGVGTLFCGWYFVRNWVLVGRPVFGGWEPERGIIWWQEPGYRTVQQFTTFGEALFWPVYSTMRGFWDGFFSTFWADGLLSGGHPPWNHTLMLSGVWLGIVPSVLLVAGMIRGVAHPVRAPALAFAALCVLSFLAAMLYAFATVPYYCVVKSSYMIGLLPCFAVLGAAGFEWFGRNRWVRSVLWGFMACWAAAAYAAYFVW